MKCKRFTCLSVALTSALLAGACTPPSDTKGTDPEIANGGRSGSGGRAGQGGSSGSNQNGSGGQMSGSAGGTTGSGGAMSTPSGSGGSGSGGSAGDAASPNPDPEPNPDAGSMTPAPSNPPGGGGGAAEPPEAATPPKTELAKHKFVKQLKTGAAPGDVAKYPVAVILNGTNFDFSQAKPLGQDVRFSNMDGTLLPYSIEQWDPAAKKAALWVQVDVKGAGTTFLMHFGNPDAESAARSKDVFSKEAGFLGVYHLNQDGNDKPDGYPDASWNDAHGVGVKVAPGSLMDGRIGAGTHLKNPGGGGANAQWIKVDGPKVATAWNGTAGNPISASVWAWADSFGGYYETIFSKGDVSWSLQRDYQGRIEACTRVPGYHACAITGKPQTKVWVHYMVVQKPGNLRLFVNGKQVATAGGTSQYGMHAFGIGNQTQYNMGAGWKRGWDGILDEARVMAADRDATWATLDFESQKPGSTWLTIGATMPK